MNTIPRERPESASTPKPGAGDWTPGPWRTHDALVFFPDSIGGFSLQNCPVPEANAQRIVACVNACEGLTEKELYDIGSIAIFLDKAAACTEPMILEREKLLERQRELFMALSHPSILHALSYTAAGTGDRGIARAADHATKEIRALLAKHGR
jgi:hypothetical protein